MPLVLGIVPPATEDELREALHLAGNQMLSYGITSFIDPGAFDPTFIIRMSELSAEGKLKQRVRACMRWTPLAGDGAIRQAIDAVAKAGASNGWGCDAGFPSRKHWTQMLGW